VTNVGIAGPTGRFGSIVLESLLENPDIKIRGLCRNASKLNRKHTQSPQFEVISGDVLEPSILHKFVDGLDVVICAYLGDNDFMVNGQKALIDACEQAKVSRYIASDYTFDYTKLELGEHPAKDPMKIIHEYLKGKQHVQGVHVLVGGFIETFWSGYFQVWNPKEFGVLG
jgi:saccharopine dehydrogenase-like NADP-dependent oxidoreductase